MTQIIFSELIRLYLGNMQLSTKNIHLLEKFELNSVGKSEKPFQISEIFNGDRRRLLKINLTDGEILKKHSANEPITIFCVGGKGVFRAGDDLEDKINLESGCLLTLESGVAHEITAEPELSLLLTKFKSN
jgi:quercetin dioxygenase-like cupin family protein